jgi:hypothetical protein
MLTTHEAALTLNTVLHLHVHEQCYYCLILHLWRTNDVCLKFLASNLLLSHFLHVCRSSITNVINVSCAGMFIFCIHNKCDMLVLNGPVVMVVKPKARNKFYTAAIFYLMFYENISWIQVAYFYARSQNCEKRLLVSSRSSVHPSVSPAAWSNSAATGWILMELDIWAFFESLSRKFKFHYNSTRLTSTVHKDVFTFMTISR